jgi:hypothetical protein
MVGGCGTHTHPLEHVVGVNLEALLASDLVLRAHANRTAWIAGTRARDGRAAPPYEVLVVDLTHLLDALRGGFVDGPRARLRAVVLGRLGGLTREVNDRPPQPRSARTHLVVRLERRAVLDKHDNALTSGVQACKVQRRAALA